MIPKEIERLFVGYKSRHYRLMVHVERIIFALLWIGLVDKYNKPKRET